MTRSRLVRLVAGLVGVALAATGCSTAHLGAGDARLAATGVVQVSRHGGAWRTARGGVLHFGDRVRVVHGSARLTLAGQRVLELRDRSRVEVRPAPLLLAGDLLVVVPQGRLGIAADPVVATVSSGAARLSRGLAFSAGVYAGSVSVESAGQSLAVPALRQADVPAVGLVPSRPVPLIYRDSDMWDRRFLGDWIDLGRDLESSSRGLTGELPAGDRPSTVFYRRLVPGLRSQPAFTPGLLGRGHDPGETVVGAAITVTGRRGVFAQRWDGVFGFRDEGAAWGLVALDQLADRNALLAQIEAALGLVGRQPEVNAPANATPVPTGLHTSTSPTTVPRRSSTTPATSPPATVRGPVPKPSTGALSVDQTVDPLVNTVNGLLCQSSSGAPVKPPGC